MRRNFVMLLFSMFATTHAAEAPVPVVKEPYHQVVFENDYVRVIDVQIPPAITTRYHTHDVASVIVYLTKSTNASQTWGESITTPRQTTPGDSRYAPYDEKALSHRVTNTGPNLFRVFDIELIRPVPAAGPFPLKPTAAIEPRWEQKRVRSSLIRLDPAARCDVPGSACAHLLINIDAAVTATARGNARTDRTLKSQEYVFFPAQTGFQIRNPGSQKSQSVLLELK
ncbi:MAG: hypothetical protein HY736_25720 [Verrucomicrobia bacterium]|nr:hypothetical protein [Verrucomicrobiota bacterium]